MRMRTVRMRATPVRRLLAVVLVAMIAVGFLSVGPLAATGAPVVVEGFMPFGFEEIAARRMAVDSVLHRGFYNVSTSSGSKLAVFDLARLKRIAMLDGEGMEDSFSVDERNHRIFYRPGSPQLSCENATVRILDTRRLTVADRALPCSSGGTAFFARGMSYDPRSDKLYLIGMPALEAIGTQSSGTNGYRESTIIRQVDPDTFTLDWEIDLSDRCDTNTNTPTAPDPVVAAVDGGIVSYCYVARQGRAVFVPLRIGRPVVADDGATIARVSPTVGRSTTPIVDQASGRLLILEDAPPFGPAAYVYDPKNERFYGVVPSGVSSKHKGVSYDYFRGFSDVSGRLYILNRLGLVVADVRSDPLPAGVGYRAIRAGRNDIPNGPIAVDGRLGRLFLPYPSRGGFVVVRDRVPAADDIEAPDPDLGTADVEERPGVTGRTFSSAANAFGAHLLITGGIPRLLNNADPLCTSSTDVHDRDEFGRCPADRVITPGNREWFFAQSALESGSDSGTTATSSAVHNPSSDTATDGDVRSIGRCGADRLPDQARDSVRPVCPNGLDADGNDADPDSEAPLEPFTAGSQGRDGNGYPVRGASCIDFDGTPSSGRSDSFGESSVSCDYAGSAAGASSRTPLLGFTQAGIALSIADAASTVQTKLTALGVVTTATSTVSGIRLGDAVRIGSIVTTAQTRARGRTGTTLATYTVEFNDVRAQGLACGTCDPTSVAEAINRAFGAQMRARVPAAYRLASPRGYQGIVQKEPGQRQSDRAVNDDDSITVNGLDLIYYNDSTMTNRDGSAGRSRIVISLAGVEAESRYGIYELPDVSDGEDFGEDSGGGDEPGTDVLGERFDDGPAPQPPAPPATGPAASGPGELIVRSFAFIRTRPAEFAMLFALWSLLAAPVYLGIRRRSMKDLLR